MKRVEIEIRDGVASVEFSDPGVSVIIRDFDNDTIRDLTYEDGEKSFDGLTEDEWEAELERDPIYNPNRDDDEEFLPYPPMRAIW